MNILLASELAEILAANKDMFSQFGMFSPSVKPHYGDNTLFFYDDKGRSLGGKIGRDPSCDDVVDEILSLVRLCGRDIPVIYGQNIYLVGVYSGGYLFADTFKKTLYMRDKGVGFDAIFRDVNLLITNPTQIKQS